MPADDPSPAPTPAPAPAPAQGRAGLSRRQMLLGGGALATLAGLADWLHYRRADDGLEAPDGRPRLQGTAPVLFIGHGSPLNVLQDNAYTRALRAKGRALGLPRAVLVVSAHWLTPGEVAISHDARHGTLHDFGGLEPELFAQRYPAPGAPALAEAATQRLQAARQQAVRPQAGRGLDHGVWTVLHHLYPAADVPVVQLSLDITREAAWHLALGQAIAALRAEGVLVLASGNVVHNLRETMETAEPSDQGLQPWAEAFDQQVKAALLAGDVSELLRWPRWGAHAQLAVPYPDHWYPLFYALGAAQAGERPQWVYEGFQNGTMGMRCVQWG